MAIRIPQVQQRGLPSTTGVRTPSADAFGAGVGSALQGAGNELMKIALDERNREDETRAREADTLYTRKLNDLKRGYSQQNGKVAFESQEDYQKAVDEIRREAMDGLANDRQRTMFSPLADRKHGEAIEFGKTYASKALKEWEIGELTAQGEMHLESAASSYGTPEGEQEMQALMENIEDLGERSGWAPDVIALQKQKMTSSAVTKKIDSMLESNPYAAQQMFKDNRDKLTMGDAAKLDNKVQTYVDKRAAFDQADRILAETDGDATAAWEATKDIQDPERRSAVQRLVKEDIRMRDIIEKDAKRRLADAEWNKILQSERPSMRDLPVPGTVDPAVYISMEKYIKHKQENPGRDIKTNDVLMNKLLLMDRDELNGVDLNQHQHELSPTDLGKLKKLQSGDPEEVRIQTTMSELYKRGLAGVGINHKKAPKRAAEFKSDVDLALQEATEAKGNKLNAAEQSKIVNEVVYRHKTKIKQGGWWPFDEEITLAEFKKQLPVDANGNTLADDEIMAIVDAIEAEDMVATPERVITYLKKRYTR